ncbi:MAG: WecB/TagA/CpsF family glycosyltransferase [Ignavibacteria bacterium]
MKNFYFKNIKVSCCDSESAVAEVIAHSKLNKPHYICVTDVGNIVNAHRKSPALKEAINNSFISLPDGRPVSLFAKLKGITNIDRVAGPDFMEKVFEKTSGTETTHFFLGDTGEIHRSLKAKLSKKYKLNVTGSLSPEFGTWTPEINDSIIKAIKTADPDFIWVSLGGGKQEIWMKENFEKLNKGIMVGVGAAFRFYTGDIKRAPYIFQRLGFEWFFRLIQQPRKMFYRYASTLPFFVLYSVQELFTNNNLKSK